MKASGVFFCAGVAVVAAAALQADGLAIAIAPPCEGLCAAIQVARERVGYLEQRIAQFGWHHQVMGRNGPVGAASQKPLTPSLDPVSDPKFFGPNFVAGKKVKGDYATDGRPTEKDHFGYPFPELQDSEDYDKDFVKDENDDNGRWKVTNHYDQTRLNLGKAKDAAAQAERDMEREKEELADAKEAEGAAEADADKHGKAADEARAAKEAAAAKSNVANETIAEAEKLLSSEVTTLEDCKEQLTKARQHLEGLMSEKNSRDSEAASTDELRGSAEANEVAAEKDDERLARRVADEREGRDSAGEEEKVTAEDIKRTEAELEVAAKKLGRFRTSDNGHDQNGGVYSGTKSGAAGPRVGAALFLGLAGLLAAA